MAGFPTGKIRYIEAPKAGYAPYANSLFIDDDIKALLDTNCGPDNIDLLQNYPIDVVINSHFHEDHIANNHKFPRAEIWAPADDAAAIRNWDDFESYYGLTLYNETDLWQSYCKGIEFYPAEVQYEFYDRETLDFGTTRIQVVHTPGHTPGHCCFLIEDSVLFSTDFGLNAFGPWYGHLCSDVTDLINSLKLCIEINPSIIIPSHRPIITEGIPQKFQRYLDVVYDHEDRLLKSLRKPSTLNELRDLYICYGPSWSKFPPRRAFEKFFILAHLKRLLTLGEVIQIEDKYCLK